MQKYLNFSEQAHEINKKHELSHNEIQILDLMAKAQFLERPVVVGDLIRQRNIASQATLHAVVKRLINKNLLYVIAGKCDRRIKQLVLTKESLDRYGQLQLAMQRSLIE